MFSFFKNKSSVFLILVITFSISLSSFSNTFTVLSGAIFDAPQAIAQVSADANSVSSSSIAPIFIQGIGSGTNAKGDSTVRVESGSLVSATFQAASSIGTSPYSGIVIGSPTPVYNGNLPNYTSYSCASGNYSGGTSDNFWYTVLTNAVCNFYWSGNTSSSSAAANSSLSSSFSSSQSSSYIINTSSVANNPTSYAIIPNCPVSVNDSINYYGGGHISLQNNSPYTSNNLSANINLPAGVTVYGLEKGYNFYQNGNNLNISFPEVGPYSEIATFYTTNYNGADYNSSAVINCNQITNAQVSSAIASSSIVNVASATVASSSRTRDQGTRDERCENNDRSRDCQNECRNQNRDARNRDNESGEERNGREQRERNCDPRNSRSSVIAISLSSVTTLPECPTGPFPDENACYCPEPKTITFDPAPISGNDHSHYCKIVDVAPAGLPVCNDEIVIDVNSCICPQPRQFADTSAEADHYHICKLPEAASSSSISSVVSSALSSVSISVSLVKPPFCESPNLVLSADKKLCICPKAGDLIYIQKDANGKEDSVCRANNPEVTSSSSTSVSSSQVSSSISTNSTEGFKECEDSDLVLTDNGKFCKCPTAGELIYIVKDANGKEDSVCRATPPEVVTSSITSVSNSSSSSVSSSSIQVAPILLTGLGSGVITIGGIGGSGENPSSTQTSSQNVNSPARLSGQLSARDVPSSCDDSVKTNDVCPSQGTLAVRQVPADATSAEMFSIDDPYTCGGNFKGKVMNTNSKTIKYEFFKNGSSTASFSYDVPVNADGTFELVVDYNIVPEDTYKIVFSAKNSSETLVSNSIEEFVTNNCTSPKAIAYFASKTVRTGGQGLTPIIMIVLGILALVGVVKFALNKPQMN
jgi:hypothetical protein